VRARARVIALLSPVNVNAARPACFGFGFRNFIFSFQPTDISGNLGDPRPKAAAAAQ